MNNQIYFLTEATHDDTHVLAVYDNISDANKALSIIESNPAKKRSYGYYIEGPYTINNNPEVKDYTYNEDYINRECFGCDKEFNIIENNKDKFAMYCNKCYLELMNKQKEYLLKDES